MIYNKTFLKLAKEYETPLFVYDAKVMEEQCKKIERAFSRYPKFKLFYPVKANSNLHILNYFRKQILSADVSSPGDVYLAMKAGFKPREISATGPNWSNDDLSYLIENRIHLVLDSLSQIKRLATISSGRRIGLRINTGISAGHINHLQMGGEKSKLGILVTNLDEVKKKVNQLGLEVVGLHMHIGSGCFQTQPFIKSLKILIKTAQEYFPQIEYLNLGGGLGVAFEPKTERDFDIKKYANQVYPLIKELNKKLGKTIEIQLEPGEFLIWKAGYLLTQINTIKKNQNRIFVGVDTNTACLPGPFLYQSYHEIAPLVKRRAKREYKKVTICGNLCQAGDVFAWDRLLPSLEEGDFLVIKNAGAYCFSRSSTFNSRLRPAEVLVSSNKIKLIRRRETLNDLLLNQINISKRNI